MIMLVSLASVPCSHCNDSALHHNLSGAAAIGVESIKCTRPHDVVFMFPRYWMVKFSNLCILKCGNVEPAYGSDEEVFKMKVMAPGIQSYRGCIGVCLYPKNSIYLFEAWPMEL